MTKRMGRGFLPAVKKGAGGGPPAAPDESSAPAGLVPPDALPLFRALATAPARRALAAAYGTAGLSVGELADAVGLSRQALASLLDSFEALGLVSRVADGRFTRVYATRGPPERRGGPAPPAPPAPAARAPPPR